jgi:chaperonin GroES
MAQKKKATKKPAQKVAAQASVKNKSFSLQPLGDRVVVKPLSSDEMGRTTLSGIIIPDNAQEKPEQGTVVAVGPGKRVDGERVPMQVAVGNRVLFSKYGYDSVKIEGVEYYVLSEEKILAVVT